MQKKLKFFENSIFQEKGRDRRRTDHSKKIALCTTTFFTPQAFKKYGRFSEAKLQIGDEVHFFNQRAIIKDYWYDDNLNVIYRLQLDNLGETCVQQELLLADNIWDACTLTEPIEEEFVRDNILPINDSVRIDALMPEILPELKEVKTVVSVKEEKTMKEIIEMIPTESTMVDCQVSIEDILEFLDLTDLKNEIAMYRNALKVYKFLVQNSNLDSAIVEAARKQNQQEDEFFSANLTTSLAFQHLLSASGMNSHIVILQNKEDGSIHDALLVQTSNKWHFFDIKKARSAFIENSENVPFDMAGLGIKELEKKYEILGVVPKKESDSFSSLPNGVAPENMISWITSSASRDFPNLNYSRVGKII